MTSRGHPYAELKRAVDRGNLWVAEAVAGEMPQLPLEDALKLVHLYAEKESPKVEKAAIRWLEPYLAEGSPNLSDFAMAARPLAEREPRP